MNNHVFDNMIKIGVVFPKTNVKLPKCWNKLTQSIYNNEHNFAILTGKINDIIVIDLDKKDDEFIGLKWIEEHFGSLQNIDTLVTKTINHGYHLFFKYTSKLKNVINAGQKNIDILTDKKCCYQGIGYDIIHNKDIRTLTQDEIKLFLQLIKPTSKTTSLNINNLSDNINDDFSYNEIKELLSYFDESVYDDRDKWLKVGYYLSTVENGKSLFDEFSKRSSKYDETRHNYDWESFKASDITIGTLLFWLKDINSKAFNKIIDNHKILNECNKITKEKYNLKHDSVIKTNRSEIQTKNTFLDDRMLLFHNCNKIDLYSKATSMGFKCYCKNCSFEFPPNDYIIIDKNVAPITYNLVMTHEDITNKDTLSVAQDILKYLHKSIIYTKNNIWYIYNNENGIYEKQERDIDFSKTIYKCIDNMLENNINNEWFNWVKKISYTEQLIKQCKVLCNHEELDANPFLLGFKNGVYDLSTDTFDKGKKGDFVSMKCAINYDPSVDTTLAQNILNTTFPDKEEREYVLNRLSLCLDGENREQSLTFMYGHTASNGKSFLMERMYKLFGDYGGNFPVNLITNKMKVAGEANTSLISFYKKRFIYCSEPESGCKLNTNFIKTLTGDILKARGLYSNTEIDIDPTFKIFVCCNELPNFDTYDEGIARRIRICEFKTKFTEIPKKKHEKKLINYTNIQKELISSGLLLLLLENYKKLKNLDYKYQEPINLCILKNIYLNDNKSVIEETLKEYFDIGSDDDYVKLMDVKRVLKNSNIKEKNLVSLIYIIEDLFENVKFIYDTGVNNDRKYKIFKNLKTKN
jgi:P4 family phage/plasmid primase-like protien